MLLISTESLTKRYGRVTALDGCTLSVRPGEIFGLLGPNGAGKTTLLRLLLGLLRPTSGRGTIFGLDCYRQSLAIRQRVAYLPGDARLFRQMRGAQVLHFFARLRPDGDEARGRQIAEQLDLNLTRRVGAMSTGMRQKLALTIVFSCHAPLLILDEPTSNLDPTIRSLVSNLVLDAQRQGRTVLFSSHILSEVEEVCGRVAILRQGRIVHTQEMSDLRQQHRIGARLNGPLPPLPALLRDQVQVLAREKTLTMHVNGELQPLLAWLSTLPISEMRIEPVGLWSIYHRYHPSAQDERMGTALAADEPANSETTSSPPQP